MQNDETVFFNGADYFDALFDDIKQAKHSVDIETYIFDVDALGERLLAYLIEAAERGVRVRILVDGAGTGWHVTFSNLLKKSGVELRVYHPFLWRFWQLKYSVIRRPFLLKMSYFFFRANKRNHRKICMVDRKIAYIGSANISMCHLPVAQGGRGWRDTIVRMVGVDLHDVEAAFEACWSYVSIKKKHQRVSLHSPIRLNNTRRRRRVLYKQLLHHMAHCKRHIWIVNSYFVPDNFLLEVLRDRAAAGVDVRIILPDKSDLLMVPLASAVFYAALLKAGVRIFEYTPGVLHAKSLNLDDWVIVGSSNLNHRSLLHDLEVDVMLRGEEAKRSVERQFLEDVAQSREISLDHWQKRGWVKRCVGRLLLYLKYWI